MRVMFVWPNERMDTLAGIGIPLLSTYLKKDKHEVKLYDTTFFDTGKSSGDSFRENLGQVIPVDLEKYGVKRIQITKDELKEDFRKAILDYKPGLIGFSTTELAYDLGLELANSIKDFDTPVIFGGIYPTFAPQVVLREPSIDMICEGEGEEAILDLVNALEKGEDITKILNITVKKDGKIYRSGQEVKLEDLPTGDLIYGEKTGLRRLPISLDKLPFPDYSIIDERRFWKKMGGKAVRTVAFELSRGCPFQCTFCCIPVFQHQHKEAIKKYAEFSNKEEKELAKHHTFRREKPIPQFIEEVKTLQKQHGINFVYFTDECFLAMSEKRFNQFIETYSEIKLPFFMETRVETILPGYAKMLESVGCEGVAMGVESGSKKVREQLLHRYMSEETIINAFKEFEKTKIRVSANNIIGFPGETREDIMQTVELNRKIKPNSTIVNVFRPYSGTELRKKCIEMGLIPKEQRAEDNRVPGAFNNGVLTAQELDGIRRVFNLYVAFSKDRWPEIRKAETDDKILEKLRQEFRETKLSSLAKK